MSLHSISLERAPVPTTRGSGSRPAKRFKVLSFEEVLTKPEPKWLVDGVVPSHGLVTLYGSPNVGKTFIALDLALAIASGQQWAGRATMCGNVLYVVAEGVAGFQKRLTAGASARHLDKGATDGIHFLDEAVQLHLATEQDGLLATLNEQIGRPVSLIIFDTLSRCFVGGEENSAKEIGELIEGADRIRKQTGATVLLVHHTTKDGNSERGSSALRGAADAMLSVTASKSVLKLECEKQKDAPSFESVRLRLVPTSGSCAVEVIDASGTEESAVISGGALQALGVLSQTQGLRWKDWLGVSGIPRGTFSRYLEELKHADLVTKDASLYILTEHGRSAGSTPK